MEDKIEVGEYISQKEFLKKNDNIVAYALYVQDNIKRDDYARLNTGQIVKVLGIKENNVNKKAIYYGFYDTDWFDCSAVKNFSKNIRDLIEEGDYVNEKKIIEVRKQDNKIYLMTSYCPQEYIREDIKSIVTKEQFENMKYEVQE